MVSKEMAYNVNSMFLLHSPFEGLDFLVYPVISLIALFVYFGIFFVCELFAYKKGERFYDRYKKAFKDNISLKEACVELGFLTAEKFDEVFHPEQMV